jgi:hypothetical protein
MSWLGTTGLALATAFMSAFAAGWFATVQSARLGESGEEGAWRGLFYGAAGFGAGFILGILIARISGGGFLRGFAAAACLVVGVAGARAAWDRRFGWVPNQLNGENVVLLAEFKMPTDWTPEAVRNPGAGYCALAPNGDLGSGHLEWNRRELREDGRWVLPCWFQLRSLYRQRSLILALGEYAEPYARFRSNELFYLTLPSEPYTEESQHWTAWSDKSNGNYEFRLRVVPERPFLAQWEAAKAVAAAEQEAARAAGRKQQWNRWAALDAKGSVELWFEPFGPLPDVPPGAADAMQAVVNERPAEVAAFLRSPDRDRVRGAVYALSIVPKIPAAVTPALIEAGSQVASYAAWARDTKAGDAQDNAEDVAWNFFERWTQAIERASPPRDNARYRFLLDEVQKASGRRHSFLPTDLPSRLVRRIDKIKAGL